MGTAGASKRFSLFDIHPLFIVLLVLSFLVYFLTVSSPLLFCLLVYYAFYLFLIFHCGDTGCFKQIRGGLDLYCTVASMGTYVRSITGG